MEDASRKSGEDSDGAWEVVSADTRQGANYLLFAVSIRRVTTLLLDCLCTTLYRRYDYWVVADTDLCAEQCLLLGEFAVVVVTPMVLLLESPLCSSA